MSYILASLANVPHGDAAAFYLVRIASLVT